MEKISRKEAMARGLTTYYTGKPCKYGHIDFRYVCDHACGQCARDKASKYRHKNPHKIKEHRANRVKKYHACEETRAKAIAESARWVRENKDRATEYQREYHRKNKERRNQQTRDAAKINKQDPEWVEKERARQSMKKKENPEAYRAYAQKRRAIIRGAEGSHTGSDVKAILFKQGGKCVYCKKDITSEYHVDHIIPLSKGGSNWPSNIQMLCPPCNGSKWAKCPIAFAKEKGMLL